MGDTTTTPAANLNTAYGSVQANMSTMETELKNNLAKVQDGGEITQSQLLLLQYNIARYTVTSATCGALIKEIADGLKQTANKIG